MQIVLISILFVLIGAIIYQRWDILLIRKQSEQHRLSYHAMAKLNDFHQKAFTALLEKAAAQVSSNMRVKAEVKFDYPKDRPLSATCAYIITTVNSSGKRVRLGSSSVHSAVADDDQVCVYTSSSLTQMPEMAFGSSEQLARGLVDQLLQTIQAEQV